MSHRVTTQTEMKDAAIVGRVCKKQNIAFAQNGDSIRFTSGNMANATLNLRTGEISGDTDFRHTRETLGALRQAYGEEKYLEEALKQGLTLETREIQRDGTIRLVMTMS